MPIRLVIHDWDNTKYTMTWSQFGTLHYPFTLKNSCLKKTKQLLALALHLLLCHMLFAQRSGDLFCSTSGKVLTEIDKMTWNKNWHIRLTFVGAKQPLNPHQCHSSTPYMAVSEGINPETQSEKLLISMVKVIVLCWWIMCQVPYRIRMNRVTGIRHRSFPSTFIKASAWPEETFLVTPLTR